MQATSVIHGPVSEEVRRQKNVETRRSAAKCVDLWKLLERRDKAVEEMQTRREGKVGRQASRYVCARKGCPIRATERSALRKCAGPCADELKPSYCGKECQQMVSNILSSSPCRKEAFICLLNVVGLEVSQGGLQAEGCIDTVRKRYPDSHF